MQTLIDTLKTLFSTEDLTPSTQPQFGDYQCNSAMKLTKSLGKPPRVIAADLIQSLPPNEIIEKTEIAGPGFINIWIKPSFLEKALNQISRDPRLGIEKPTHPQRIIVEFSSPNIAKEMHVGHLRSTIIGDTLARLFEFLGHDVLRLNHIGDWGTAFGMLIAFIKEQNAHPTTLPELMELYRGSKKRFDEDPAFKKQAQTEVVHLQGGDPQSLATWHLICDISRKAYQIIYDLLDIKLQERGESFYNPALVPLIADLEARGQITLSEGAKCIFVEGYDIPFMVQKSDGGYNYDTTDLAAIRQRINEEKVNRIIYVVDAGQGTHFQLLFKAAEKVGYLDPTKTHAEHVPFGLVLGADGKKLKTRSGETIRLMELIDNAILEAKVLLEKRGLDIPGLAHILGINAIKYADLSGMRTQDYHFSFEKMLRFEGNTAAFLMYAYVRVFGLKRKIGDPSPNATIQLTHPSETALGLHLLRFQEILQHVASDLLPHRLAEYLYTLAEKFNAFFRDCRVEGTPEQDSRLLLADLTARTLATGMQILGLQTTERM